MKTDYLQSQGSGEGEGAIESPAPTYIFFLSWSNKVAIKQLVRYSLTVRSLVQVWLKKQWSLKLQKWVVSSFNSWGSTASHPSSSSLPVGLRKYGHQHDISQMDSQLDRTSIILTLPLHYITPLLHLTKEQTHLTHRIRAAITFTDFEIYNKRFPLFDSFLFVQKKTALFFLQVTGELNPDYQFFAPERSISYLFFTLVKGYTKRDPVTKQPPVEKVGSSAREPVTYK